MRDAQSVSPGLPPATPYPERITFLPGAPPHQPPHVSCATPHSLTPDTTRLRPLSLRSPLWQNPCPSRKIVSFVSANCEDRCDAATPGCTQAPDWLGLRLAACVQESCTLYKNLVQTFFRTSRARPALPRGSVDDPNSPSWQRRRILLSPTNEGPQSNLNRPGGLDSPLPLG